MDEVCSPLLDRHKRSGDVPSVISRGWNSNLAAGAANDVFEAVSAEAAVLGKAKGDYRFVSGFILSL